MKKLILLLVIALSIISCNSNSNTISEQQFIDNLNSFDSTAKYSATNINMDEVSFVISSGDSLFVYHVERCVTADAIYVSKKPGDNVK